MNKILLIWAFGCLSAVSVYAQTSLPDMKSDNEYCTPVQPYEIEVCYDKTMHIIFPSAIIYVDLGSRDIIADKAGGAENVLRVKAANRDFRSQTNISVITDKGDFYTFDVRYSEVLRFRVLKCAVPSCAMTTVDRIIRSTYILENWVRSLRVRYMPL